MRPVRFYLCCAVQENHLATFAPTELRSLLVEPRFERNARKISGIAKNAHLVSVRSDLNDPSAPEVAHPQIHTTCRQQK